MIDIKEPAKTFYCNSACQTADWTHHKQACKLLFARKRLYRAGDIVQRIFYVYREHTFNINITEVDKSEDTMYLYEGKYGRDILSPFPYHLFHSEEDKRAALTYCNCAVAVAFMLKIIEGFLKGKPQHYGFQLSSLYPLTVHIGLYTKIDEVNMELQETPRRIYLVDEHGNLDTTEYGHTLLRVSLKSGESYAFDLTGAQFGYYETITPWSLYEQSRAKKGSIAFSPSDLRLTLIIAASSNSPTVPGITWRYNKSLANVVKGTGEEFADMKGTEAVCDMLKLAQVAFECKSDQLVYCVAKVLTNFKAELKRQGRLPRARPFQIGEVWHDERSGC